MARTNDDQTQRLERIEKAVAAVRKAEEELTAAVVAARTPAQAGYWHPEVPKWEDIAEALGVTRQAAAKRWGGVVPKVRADRSYW